MNNEIGILESADIFEALPHRPPFLLIDRVLGGMIGKDILATKLLSVDGHWFDGHFPGQPIMPGVLIIEAMAQAGGILAYLSLLEKDPKPLYFLAGVDNARFRKPVLPGDELSIHVEVIKVKRGMWFYSGEVMVNEDLIVSANIICAPRGNR